MASWRKPPPHNLWPELQGKENKEIVKPEHTKSSVTLGDSRLNQPNSMYKINFREQITDTNPRVPGSARLEYWDQMTPKERQQAYARAMKRVSSTLSTVFATLKLRLAAKMGTSNNAFKMRQFFSTFDVDGSGSISLKEFRYAFESYGIQLSEDHMLAIFSQYDVNFDGNVDYSEFMKILLDPDQYALFSVGESKAAMRKATALSDRDKVRHFYMVHRSKLFANAATIHNVCERIDINGTGYVTLEEFLAECEHVGIGMDTDSQGLLARSLAVGLHDVPLIAYQGFCGFFMRDMPENKSEAESEFLTLCPPPHVEAQ